VAGSAVQNLQGRVAGVTMNRNSGQPGEGVSIMLRSPTSLRGSGAPMVVVDGVILGGVLSDANTTAIEGMDIESIEIIRGAAAASLYGSRAASGVINITTARGRSLEAGQTRFSARSEFGTQQPIFIPDLPTHHHYRMNEAGTAFVNAQGQEVPRGQRVVAHPSTMLQFMDQPYPGPVFDNLRTVLQPGNFQAHNFTVSQNTASTNFAASLARTHEQGALEGNDGYYRNSFRINLDHRFLERLSLGISASHARDGRDNLFPTNLFSTLLTAPRDVDLSVRDASGNYIQQPDPEVAYQNPLWTQSVRDGTTQGNRTLLSSSLAWSPLAWLTGSALVSYDRREQNTRSYIPKGTPLAVGQEGEDDGSISFSDLWTDTWNAEAQATLRRNFGRHDGRITFRGLMERDQTIQGTRSGNNFILFGIPQLSNVAPNDRNASSAEREVRALGYLVDTGFGFFDGRYTATVLGRRDGSSLFGADARWRDYYRVAGAWIMSEENWFNVNGLDHFKLAYARGTAGGRPGWAAQYETWALVQGLPTKQQLGNRQLRPEHTLEQEVSANAIIGGRYSVELTHAWQKTTDQIVPAPQPVFVGYTTQWVNAGTVEGNTTEFTVEAQLLQSPTLAWTSMLVADYSTATITEWPLPCDASRTWRFDCAGEPVYGIYGFRLLTSFDELSEHRGGALLPFADQFQINDEGYLVWVGDKSYTDGMVNGQVQAGTWGTSTALAGSGYQWGIPFFAVDADGNTIRESLGTGSPVNFGWLNNLRLRGFNIHTHMHASVGGVANNRAYQDLINDASRNFPGMDQGGKPDGLKKPIGYYQAAVGSGGSNYITEDASYLKLRSVALSYRFNPTQLQRIGFGTLGMENLELGLTARNIFTLTRFSGFDPEMALDLNNRLNWVGTGAYPSTRTLTATVGVTF
jgi:TonB-linked SusC/RagA family outer membrane protein